MKNHAHHTNPFSTDPLALPHGADGAPGAGGSWGNVAVGGAASGLGLQKPAACRVEPARKMPFSKGRPRRVPLKYVKLAYNCYGLALVIGQLRHSRARTTSPLHGSVISPSCAQMEMRLGLLIPLSDFAHAVDGGMLPNKGLRPSNYLMVSQMTLLRKLHFHDAFSSPGSLNPKP